MTSTKPAPPSPARGGIDDVGRKQVLDLLRTRPPDARERLESIASTDPSATVRYVARRALAVLDDGHQSVVLTAQQRPSPPPKAWPGLVWLQSPSGDTRGQGIAEAVRTGERQAAIPMLQIVAADPVEALRLRACEYFIRHGRPSDLVGLIPLTRGGLESVRAALPAVLIACDPSRGIPYVAYLLQDSLSPVRKAARAALAQLAPEAFFSAIEEMLASERPWLRDSAVHAASHLADPASVRLLEKGAVDAHPGVALKARHGLERLAQGGVTGAAEALSRIATLPAASAPDPKTAPSVAESNPNLERISAGATGPATLDDPNPKIRLLTLAQAVERKDRTLAGRIARILETSEESHPFVVSKLVIALGHLGDPSASKVLRSLLSHGDPRVVASAIEALDLIGATDARAAVRPLTAHKVPRVRANALVFCRDDPSVDVEGTLKRMLTAREYPQKLSALWALSRLPHERYGPLVELVLGDINDDVRERAFGLLERWASEGAEDAKAMLEMCLAGDVAIKRESLRLQAARPVRRMLAFAQDVVAFGLVTAMVAGVAIAPAPSSLARLVGGCVAALGFLAFFTRDGFNSGRGFGKKAYGLRTVSLASNAGCTKAQSLIRTGLVGLGMAGFVELVMIHTDESGRRMADWLLGTQVIEEQDRPMSSMESIGGGFLYLMIFCSIAGSFLSLLAPGDRKYEDKLAGYTVDLPSGWTFSQRRPLHWQAVRTSLWSGQDLVVDMQSSLGDRKLRRKAIQQDQMEEGRESLLGRLRKEGLGEAQFTNGPADCQRTVSGQPACQYDVVFDLQGHHGRARGLRFIASGHQFDLTAIAISDDDFRRRESELDQLISKIRFR